MEINKVVCMDCKSFMSTLPDEFFTLIIADIPYFEIIKNDWDNQWKNEKDYIVWVEGLIKDFTRILKPNGSLYMYCSQQMAAEIDLILRKYMIIKNRIIWYRSGGLSPKNKFKLAHEPIFYCVKDINNHTWNADNIRVQSKYAGKDKRLNPKGKVPDDVWEVPNLVGKKKESVGHPTQKPLPLGDRMVKVSSNELDLVYIPFAGSGSEIINCIQSNRNWIATETNKAYIKNMIMPRIKEKIVYDWKRKNDRERID